MSTPVSPVEHKLPQRSATVSSSLTRQTSISDNEAIPDTDSNEVCTQCPWRNETRGEGVGDAGERIPRDERQPRLTNTFL
jgi:hypothetical protein